MKAVTYEVPTPTGRQRRLGGFLDDDENGRIADLTAAFAAHLAAETAEPTPREYAALRTPPDMIGWLRAGQPGRDAAEAALQYARARPDEPGLDGARLVYARSEVKLLAPLPRPIAFRDFSMYEEHMTLAEGRVYRKGSEWYTCPPYYKGSCNSIAGPEDPVPWPHYTEKLDLELEVGIIIGREGRDLTVEEAAGYIAGYTILVDSSARDHSEREMLGPTKRKDFHTALGPCLVTADEVDVENLACRLSVDGEVWFEGTTAAPHSFTPAQLVAYASDSETIYPGEILGTGTIGTACSIDTHKWIKPGQVATFWIERLGSMSLSIIRNEPRVRHVPGMTGLLTPKDR